MGMISRMEKLKELYVAELVSYSSKTKLRNVFSCIVNRIFSCFVIELP